MKKPICIIAGVGPGNGLAICKKFHGAGYKTVILARDLARLREYSGDHEDIHAFACDLSDPDAIDVVFTEILSSLGVPEVVIYNAGSGLFGTPLEVSHEDFEGAWRINALGLLAVAKIAAPAMIENGGGCILITGATASLRGGANFAAFSSAKAAQRNLAQSLGRSLGSQGIHVALLIIDGIIDIPRTREMFPDKANNFFVQPGDIADTFYHLARQKKSAWTFEMDIRTNSEKW